MAKHKTGKVRSLRFWSAEPNEKAPKARKYFWALTRDGAIYSIWITRKVATETKQIYQPNSKYKWGVVKVRVSRA